MQNADMKWNGSETKDPAKAWDRHAMESHGLDWLSNGKTRICPEMICNGMEPQRFEMICKGGAWL